jgi:putrescine transport system ATP-binding protein
MLEGRVESADDGHVVLDGPDGKITGALRGAPIDKDTTAWFAIRPEKIEISRTKPEGSRQCA